MLCPPIRKALPRSSAVFSHSISGTNGSIDNLPSLPPPHSSPNGTSILPASVTPQQRMPTLFESSPKSQKHRPAKTLGHQWKLLGVLPTRSRCCAILLLQFLLIEIVAVQAEWVTRQQPKLEDSEGKSDNSNSTKPIDMLQEYQKASNVLLEKSPDKSEEKSQKLYNSSEKSAENFIRAQNASKLQGTKADGSQDKLQQFGNLKQELPGNLRVNSLKPRNFSKKLLSNFSETEATHVKSEESDEKIAEERRSQFYSRVQNVPMSNQQGMELYQKWIDQALSSLMAAVAQKKLKTLSRPVQDEFGQCSGGASTVPRHARCVSRLLRGGFDGHKIYAKAYKKSERFDRFRMQKRAQMRGSTKMDWLKGQKERWVGAFRMAPNQWNRGPTPLGRRLLHAYTGHRRERRQSGIVKKNYYQLLSPSQSRLGPLGSVAKLMMAEVLRVKGKREQDIVPWQQTIARLQGSARKRNQIRKRLEDEATEESEGPDLDQLKFRGLKRRGLVGEDLHALADDPQRLRAFLKRARASKAADPVERMLALMREGIGLGYRIAGQNGTDLERKTLRTLSPRFLSVTPEEDPGGEKTLDMLSPSLFSLHSEGAEGTVEQLTSLPNLVKGLSSRDQQAWMNLIFEASGVVEQAEKIEEELGHGEVNKLLRSQGPALDRDRYEREIRAKDGTPLYFTKKNVTDVFGTFEERKCDVFEKLELSLSKDQLREMNSSGFAMLSQDQLHLLYGPKSPYNDSEALRRFKRMSTREMHAGLAEDVHTLAEQDSFRVRQRDVVLSPILFTTTTLRFLVRNPVILSPILFSPLILSPAILGPTILSPWMFVPVVLSPRALSPTILSPLGLNPVILSPFVLHPVILSPGFLNPIVLNPFVLSPFILSPQVFTPLILSPTVLSPYILNPGVGNPLVLSPYVLGPIILSPQFLSALILSPYALSPVIYSPLTAVTVILSPSWLS